MPFTKLDGFTKLISALPDHPNETMTSAELKQWWDNSPEELRVALNGLMDELQASGAAGTIGANTVTGLSGATIQELLYSLKTYIDTHKNNTSNPHVVTASQLNVYTKDELAPYLQGGDTTVIEEVFTIVNSNNGNGTFTYSDSNGNNVTGSLDGSGGQIFTFQDGTYDLGLNRVECIVGDTLRRSVKSGGLAEVDTTHVTLTMPEGNGREITFRYFQRIGVTGEANLFVSDIQPPFSIGNTVWMKVIG